MTTMADNFTLLANLDEAVAVQIQSMLRLLEDNTSTRLTLSNLNTDAQTVDFTIDAGSMDDLQQACDFKSVKINGNTLSV